jgi:hypothetical protein
MLVWAQPELEGAVLWSAALVVVAGGRERRPCGLKCTAGQKADDGIT